MPYYEFNGHEYYALIQAEGVNEACEYYVEFVANETVEDVLDEGHPNLITELQALVKLAEAICNVKVEVSVSEVIDILYNEEIPMKIVDNQLFKLNK
jgi:formiminotetrahydrofolate cyclodeaminase